MLPGPLEILSCLIVYDPEETIIVAYPTGLRIGAWVLSCPQWLLTISLLAGEFGSRLLQP